MIVLSFGLAFIVKPSDAGLSEIVKTGPYEIADDVGIFLHLMPVGGSVARIRLSLPHHTLRTPLMVGGRFMYHIVVAYNVEGFGMGIVDLPVAVPCAECLRDGARRIEPAALFGKLPRCRHHSDMLALYHLVADAPGYHGWMVAVAAHKIAHVFHAPFIYPDVVVFGILRIAPSVEGLVDDEQSLAVTFVKECRRGRIVARAYGIETAFLQKPYLAGLGSIVGGCAEHTVVVVGAGAVEHYRLSIQPKAILSGIGHGAYAEILTYGVKFLSAGEEPYLHAVEGRRFRAPKLRRGNIQLAGYTPGFHRKPLLRHFFTGRTEDSDFSLDILFLCYAIHIKREGHFRLRLADVRSRDR